MKNKENLKLSTIIDSVDSDSKRWTGRIIIENLDNNQTTVSNVEVGSISELIKWLK